MTPIFSSGMAWPLWERDKRVSEIRLSLEQQDRDLAGVLEREHLEVDARASVLVGLALEPVQLHERHLAGQRALDRALDDGAQALELVVREACRQRRVDRRLHLVGPQRVDPF